MKPFFTVVISLYNKELVIERTIHSVLNQSEQDFEIVVVNDGSDDGSHGKVESINSEKIRIVSQKNQGPSVARNRGIREANGSYIALLDGDDLWQKNHLSTMKRLINNYPLCGYYATAHKVKLNNNREKKYAFGFEPGYEGIVNRYFYHSSKYKKPGTSSSIVVPKAIFSEVGNFNTVIKSGEDVDMWFRIALRYPVAFSNKVTAIYMQDNEDVSRLSIYKKQKNLEKTSKGIHERLLVNREQYHESDYIKDIDRFIATLQLKNTISMIKSVGIKHKPKVVLNRFRNLRNRGISNTDIIISLGHILKFIFRKRFYKLH